MSGRGRSRSVEAGTKRSRDSSVSSTEVRCACQYYQSDSLLPERKNPVGRPMASRVGDHEYEVINPPKENVPPEIRESLVDEEEVNLKEVNKEKYYVRIPPDDELVVHPDGISEDEAMAGRELGDTTGDGSITEELDSRYLAGTPTTTNESRTDDINTSQVDSSGLEDLPLKKGQRKKKMETLSDKQAQARSFQQKVRQQAKSLRTKLRNISRPKFNLPERPKFNLPERPKFNLPERPKFNFPERPKFSLPERPKFSMPKKTFNVPSLSKQRTSSTRRPLRENPESESSSPSKSRLFDFKTYPRLFDKMSRKRNDFITSSPKASRASTPPPLSLTADASVIPVVPVYSIHNDSYDQETEKMAEITDKHIEEIYPSNGVSEIDDNLELAELNARENEEIFMQESRNINGKKDSDFEDTQFRRSVEAAPSSVASSVIESDREQRSSMSSLGRHRSGVLEEIDSDEFFLREKGLSLEDIEVGKYISSEIRDAFRAPPPNALLEMQRYGYEGVNGEVRRTSSAEQIDFIENSQSHYYHPSASKTLPTRPRRTRSMRTRYSTSARNAATSSEENIPQGVRRGYYKTYPPVRPKRTRSKSQENKFDNETEINGENENDFGEEDQQKTPLGTTPVEVKVNGWELQIEEPPEEPPAPPKRMKKSIQSEQFADGEFSKDIWVDEDGQQVDTEGKDEIAAMEHEYIIPESQENIAMLTPIPPRRSRRHDSTGDEDRTSHGASSLPFEEHIEIPTEEEIREELKLSIIDAGYATVEKIKPSCEYEEPVDVSPPLSPPTPVRRHKRRPTYPVISKRFPFKSLPRMRTTIPVRPIRNYSTLGPSKPPRNKYKRISKVIVEPYTVIDNEVVEMSEAGLDSMEMARDLQAGEVLEKMKSRPLPPPPRPPRKRTGAEDAATEDQIPAITGSFEETCHFDDMPLNLNQEEMETIDFIDESESIIQARLDVPLAPSGDPDSVAGSKIVESIHIPTELKVQEEISFLSAYENEPNIEEVSVATQTDPLQDEICVEETSQYVDAISPETGIGSIVKDEFIETPVEKEESKPVQKEEVREEISKQPPDRTVESVRERTISIIPSQSTEIEILRTHRLHVSELDVSRLNVGELQAQKIVVSDIDGVTLQVSELSSNTGNLVVSGLELPPNIIQDLSDAIEQQVVSKIKQYAAANVPPPPPTPTPPPPTPTATPLPSQQHHDVTIPSTSSPSKVPESTTSADPVSPPTTHSQAGVEINENIPRPVNVPIQEIPCKISSSKVTEAAEKVTAKVVSTLPEEENKQNQLFSKCYDAVTLSPTEIKESQPCTSKASAEISQEDELILKNAQQGHQQESQVTSRKQKLCTEARIRDPQGILHQHSTQAQAALPQAFIQEYTSMGIPVTTLELESDEDLVGILPAPHSRRRRHLASKQVRHYSSDEEEELTPVGRRHHTPREPSVVESGKQLFRAFKNAVNNAIRNLFVSAGNMADKQRDIQAAMCILLIVITVLILMGIGSGKTVYFHHWDFHFPPPY